MGEILVRGGAIVPMTGADQPTVVGDVLIRDGRIAKIGAKLTAPEGAEVIDATGKAVMPGLIDGHRHLWYTPLKGTTMDHGINELSDLIWANIAPNITATQMYHATRAGIVDALQHGVTTVVDYNHALNTPEHADQALRAHHELPGRALFAYGGPITDKFTDPSAPSDWSHAISVIEASSSAPSTRTRMALAIQSPAISTRERFERDVQTARDLGVPIIAHVSPWAGGEPEYEVTHMHEWGLLGPDMHFSHCCAATDTEYGLLRDAGVSVTITPLAESMGGLGVPPIRRMHTAGLYPSVGADAICGPSGDLFEEARAALVAFRLLATQELNASGRRAEVAADIPMSAYEALASITSRGAAAAQLSDEIGTLEVGKRADILLVDLPPEGVQGDEVIAWIVGAAHGSDVSTVIVDGRVVKSGGVIQNVDLQGITAGLREARRSMLGQNN